MRSVEYVSVASFTFWTPIILIKTIKKNSNRYLNRFDDRDIHIKIFIANFCLKVHTYCGIFNATTNFFHLDNLPGCIRLYKDIKTVSGASDPTPFSRAKNFLYVKSENRKILLANNM